MKWIQLQPVLQPKGLQLQPKRLWLQSNSGGCNVFCNLFCKVFCNVAAATSNP
jgi:hypothetical protein